MCCLLKDLNANLATLTAQFEKATAEKIKCQQEADATNRVITLANRYCASMGLGQSKQLAPPAAPRLALLPPTLTFGSMPDSGPSLPPD